MPQKVQVRRWNIGRDEIIFIIAAGGLIAMTYAAVVQGRQADATLVAAFVGLLGLPVFLGTGKKEGGDGDR